LHNKCTGTIVPARALAAETLNLEQTLSDFVKQDWSASSRLKAKAKC
jgi:hypothetical protein